MNKASFREHAIQLSFPDYTNSVDNHSMHIFITVSPAVECGLFHWIGILNKTLIIQTAFILKPNWTIGCELKLLFLNEMWSYLKIKCKWNTLSRFNKVMLSLLLPHSINIEMCFWFKLQGEFYWPHLLQSFPILIPPYPVALSQVGSAACRPRQSHPHPALKLASALHQQRVLQQQQIQVTWLQFHEIFDNKTQNKKKNSQLQNKRQRCCSQKITNKTQMMFGLNLSVQAVG